MKTLVLVVSILIPFTIVAQQQTDTTFAVDIDSPKYSIGEGPVICFDSAHNNFHTLNGGFAPTAFILKKDGYRTIDFS
ncbi:MAG TPA: hypothetical protein DEG32_12220, partial [Balneolaceae bacterium]|nr:hypothetical protein [Balneolaceae bacterium]